MNGNEAELTWWDYARNHTGMIGAGLVGCIVILFFRSMMSQAHNGQRSTNLTLTIGMIAIAAMTAFVEQYLRILQHFVAVSPDVVDAKSSENESAKSRISYGSILRHLCSFGQRLLTYRAAFLLVTNSQWNILITSSVFGIILIPRIMFALFLIRNSQDLSKKHPDDPNKDVNLSKHILHYIYKGFRKFFRVLDGMETWIFFLSKQIQFVTMQLFGYSYNVKSILIYGDLETILFLGWNFYSRSELQKDFLYLFALVLIIFLRVCVGFTSIKR